MKKYLLISAFALIAIAITSFAIWSPLTSIVADKDYPANSDEPDMPGFLSQAKDGFSKEEFMRMRAEGIALKRGLGNEELPDPASRPKAIEKMEQQEARVAELTAGTGITEAIQAAWTPIGPAPIPNGQTTPPAPVSGRTISIAVHPTNPNIVYVGTAQGGVYRSLDGGTNWTPIFDSAQSLEIGAIAIAPSNPEIVYVGTGEPNFSQDSFFGVGVYRIENASTTATLNGPLNLNAAGNDVFLGRSIGEIRVHPTNPDIIFVGSTSGTAGFRSASATGFPPRGIFRSDNATTANPTFAKLTFPFTNQDFSIRDLALDPQNPDNLVANVVANGGGLLTTNNALNADPTTVTFTLTQQFTGTSISNLTAELTVQKSGGTNGARTYYAATGFGNGRVYRSTDSGATWTLQITNNFCNPQCFYDIAIDIDPTDPNTLYLGGSPTLIVGKSIDGGISFPIKPTAGLHVDTHALAVAPSDPTIVFLGTDGGIYKSIDAGTNFTPLNNTQFSATQFVGMDVHPTDPNFTLGGTQDNGTNFYMPSAMWRRADFGDGGFAVIDQNAPDVVNVRMYHTYFNSPTLQGYATVSNTAQAMDNGWAFRGCQAANATGNGITCNGTVNFYAPLERGPGNPNTIYYGTDRLYRSANEGLNHTVVSQNPIVAGVPISSIGISPQNDNVRIVGLNNGGLYGTSTGATTLVNLDPANQVPDVAINRSIIDPNNPATAYVALSVFGIPNVVYKTTNLGDTGTTWTNSSGTGATALPQVPVDVIIIDPLNSNIVYAGTDIGVYVSANGGATWLPFGTGLPRVAIFDMKITPGRLVRVATHGRGMYQIPAFVAPTAAGVTIAGRVSFSNGFGLGNSVVSLTDSNGETRITQTSSFGYFKFEDVQAGETYTITAQNKRYRFTPQVINVSDNLLNINLIAE